MNAARILYPVKTLGPGKRVGLWLCGCHRRCVGCSNPELWERRPEYEISAARLAELIGKIVEDNPVDGFTVTGGEPLNQAEELLGLLDFMREISGDILIYTGYTMEEIAADRSSPAWVAVRKAAAVVDGVYIEARNRGGIMVGSDNQRVFIVDRAYGPLYRDYLRGGGARVQNFAGNGSVYSVGIHRAGFADEMIRRFAREESGNE